MAFAADAVIYLWDFNLMGFQAAPDFLRWVWMGGRRSIGPFGLWFWLSKRWERHLRERFIRSETGLQAHPDIACLSSADTQRATPDFPPPIQIPTEWKPELEVLAKELGYPATSGVEIEARFRVFVARVAQA